MFFKKRKPDSSPSKKSYNKQLPKDHPNPPIRVVRGNTEEIPDFPCAGCPFPGSPSPRPKKKN